MTVIFQSSLLLCGDIHPNPGPQGTDFSICHANIRSIRNPEKVDHIANSLAEDYDIITLSETWLQRASPDSQLALKNFQQPFRRDRVDDSGYGGVLAWVSNEIVAKRRKDLELKDLEAMWLEIRVRNHKLLLCTVYRPPNSSPDFWDMLQESIDLARATTVNSLVITGDLNSDPNSLQEDHTYFFTIRDCLAELVIKFD